MSVVLGIHGNFGRSEHDSAAAIVHDGVLVQTVEEERLVRYKHSVGLMPDRAIAACLKAEGFTLKDVDCVAFPRATWRNFKTRLQAYLSYQFGHVPPIRFYDHHLSHAAAAYYPSAFDLATVLTIDQSGDGRSLAVFDIDRRGATRLLHEQRFPDSLGLLAAIITQLLGFQSNDSEFKVMGLAAYGEPTIDLGQLVKVEGHTIEFNQNMLHAEAIVKYPEFHTDQLPLFSDSLEKALGIGRRIAPDDISKEHANLAASFQSLLEGIVASLAEAFAIPGKPLCLGGGVAQNSLAAGQLAQRRFPDPVFVPPFPGDSGTAVGAAMLAALDLGDQVAPISTPFLAPPEADADAARQYIADVGLRATFYDDPLGFVAEAISSGKVVAWHCGRPEVGPRSLGARSLLANPSTAATRDVVNRIKRRESFRPFAPSLLANAADRILPLPVTSPYMSFTVPLSDHGRVVLPAASHVDGTARIHTVETSAHPFAQLLQRLSDYVGIPAVLNTSLNVKGEPICRSPADTVRFFASSSTDVLYLEGHIVVKP